MRTTLEVVEGSRSISVANAAINIHYLQKYSRLWMAFLLTVSDLTSLFAAGALAVGIRYSMGNGLLNPEQYLQLTPLLIFFWGVYAWRGLYPAVGLSPVEELRRLTVSTSIVFLVITAFTFWARNAEEYSRLVLTFTWVLSLFFVQGGRWLLRWVGIRLGIWGEPVAIVGNGIQGQRIVEFLHQNMRFGLRPVITLDEWDDMELTQSNVPQLHVSSLDLTVKKLKSLGIKTTILIVSEMSDELQRAILDEQRYNFRRLILIPDLLWIGSVGVVAHDFESFLGLEVRHNLLNGWQRNFKRILDVFIVIIVSPFILPIIACIAFLVWLDSRGNILYGHERVGKNGQKIKVWKFRTMVPDADGVLFEYLDKHPELREEWETSQKIKNDPRITRMGKWLRKLSLDELPQLWNVLKGEMSLVGPRPIVTEEIKHYRQGFKLYSSVLPGLTGLWQVSGRNDVGYESRVRFDEYYVRNWSMWLDIYILLKTFWVVFRGHGAY